LATLSYGKASERSSDKNDADEGEEDKDE